MDAKTSQFVSAMNSFIDGEKRGKNVSNEIESMLSELYDEDERFENLQYALSMFGARITIEADEEMLIKELKHAKNIICVPNS